MHCFKYAVFGFFTLAPCTLFCMYSVLIVCHVSCLGSVLYVFSIILWYVSALRTLLNVFWKTFTYVGVLRTVLNLFCMRLWYGSSSRTVFNGFCTFFLRRCFMHCFQCVPFDGLSHKFLAQCFLCDVFECLVR